jgi:hypothetical protein
LTELSKKGNEENLKIRKEGRKKEREMRLFNDMPTPPLGSFVVF